MTGIGDDWAVTSWGLTNRRIESDMQASCFEKNHLNTLLRC